MKLIDITNRLSYRNARSRTDPTGARVGYWTFDRDDQARLGGESTRMALKRGSNSLKRGPNVLKTTRNRMSFRQNGTIFRRISLKSKELQFWPLPGVFKPNPDKDLRPIMAGGG
jgi:hypothetical protein